MASTANYYGVLMFFECTFNAFRCLIIECFSIMLYIIFY